MSDLSEHGLTLHQFQPYPGVRGFWSFQDLLDNGWQAASVTFAGVRSADNVVEFQLSLTVGHAQNIVAANTWPEPLRPHANTRRTVYINRVAHEMFIGTLGQFRLNSWSPDLEGELLIGDFSIGKRMP